jgi:hypothetical protein
MTPLPGVLNRLITDYPLGDILRNQDATGRISKWAVEHGTLNIDFKPRTAIKSRPLVDFMAEWQVFGISYQLQQSNQSIE